MADKNVREQAEKEGRIPAQTPEAEIDLKGFKNLNPEQAFGWFKKSPGAICYGEYLGRFEKTWDDSDEEGSEKFYHQVRIWNPTVAAVANADGRGSTDQMAKRGVILNVDESKSLEAMKTLPEQNNGKHVVFIKYIEKVKIPGTSRTFWKAEVKVRDLTSKDSIPF